MRCLFKGNSQWQVDLMLVTVGILIDVLYDIQRRKEKRIGLKTFKKESGKECTKLLKAGVPNRQRGNNVLSDILKLMEHLSQNDPFS
jgi:hypothetical protein